MRFISLSRRVQIVASLVCLSMIVWFSVATYSYIYRADILAAKDREQAATEKKYIQANDQFDKLKNDIEKSTKTLEQRQIYLQQLLEADKSLSSTPAPGQDISGGKTDLEQGGKTAPATDNDNSSISFVYSRHQQQLASLQFSIARIEHQQQALAENMIERLSKKIAYVEKTLKKSGIASRKLIELSKNRPSLSMAMGGPFILYAGGNDQDDFSDKEPYARLYSHYNRLIDLESAIQHIPVGIPVKKYYISSGFGIRKDPFRKTWAHHYGLDMAGWWKTPIYAPADGTVIRAGWNGAYGNFIEIDHGNGFRSRYGHLSRILVKKGDHVTLEQKIGLMGTTGRSTSPHLHYEIWFNGKPINPMKIFKASNNVLKIQRQEYGS